VQLCGFPAAEVEFDRAGELVGDRGAAVRELTPGQRLTIDAAADLVPALTVRATARTAFAAALLSVASRGADDPEDASTQLFTLPGGTVMDRLGTAGFADAASHLLDFLACYEMKARAGEVGVRGLAPLLATLAGPKIHLVGHSFGGRLVTAAANARPTGSVATLTLLQAAFSHHGFAADRDGRPGAFRGVLDERVVTGPILVTHTANDLAVGVAYAIASRIAGQTVSALGDASSPYGGLGRNGAQRTAEAVTAELLPVGGSYRWRPGVPHNLLADRFVRGHTDVCGPQIAHALWSAIAASY
jgi:dienelactone hydrolase